MFLRRLILRAHRACAIAGIAASWCAGLASGVAFAELPDGEFRQHVEARIESGEYVGLIVGFIDGDETHTEAFGTVSRTSDEPPNERTLFEISSVAKTFTATLLARAAAEERVRLEDSANLYLGPDARLDSYEGREITLKDLGAHQSGLPYMPADIEPGEPPNPYAGTTAEDLVAAINVFEASSRPGQGYSYSAFAYGVLALILERVYDSTFFSLVERDVTGPLGMRDTVLTLNAEQAPRLATGYTPEGEPAAPLDQGIFNAAGSMYSSLDDLMIWLRANMHPEASTLGDALVLTRQIQNELGTIGLTWHRTEGYDDRSQYGTANGYRAYVGFLADGSKGAVVLANTRVDAEALGNRLLLGTALPD